MTIAHRCSSPPPPHLLTSARMCVLANAGRSTLRNVMAAPPGADLAPLLPRASLTKRRVGGSPIPCLKLVRIASEFVQREAEDSRDAINNVPRRVGYSTLKPPDRGRVEIRSIGEGLLREANFFSTQTDRPAEGNLGSLADPHA
jgi:hypothetical protein